MVTLSAPTKSGYEQQFDNVEEARTKAAWLLDIPVEEMVETESGDGGTTYCYADQDAADSDRDGAYAVQYSYSEVEE